MVTLQQYKEKLNTFIEEKFYNKDQIDIKESVLNDLIDEKADKTNATQSTAGLMSAEDKSKLDNIEDLNINIKNINNVEEMEDDGFYLIEE